MAVRRTKKIKQQAAEKLSLQYGLPESFDQISNSGSEKKRPSTKPDASLLMNDFELMLADWFKTGVVMGICSLLLAIAVWWLRLR